MSTKHTQGPWEFYTEPQPNGLPIVGTRGLMVAMLAHSINHEAQRETALANARLIAAAPELLKALQALVDAYEKDAAEAFHQPWLKPVAIAARAAIAKATGEQA